MQGHDRWRAAAPALAFLWLGAVVAYAFALVTDANPPIRLAA
jgi:hypothetical protein